MLGVPVSSHALVVAEDEDYLEIVSIMLELSGLQVSRATSKNEALLRLSYQYPRYSVIVVVLEYYEAPGWEIVAECKGHPGGRGVPIFVISSDGKVSTRVHADALLKKASLFPDLHAALGQFLQPRA